jgi:hypothetical protein
VSSARGGAIVASLGFGSPRSPARGARLLEEKPEWRDALAQLETRPRPDSIPAERWAQTTADARYLVREWSVALSRCGWTLPISFRRIRRGRLPASTPWGLCLLLQGRKVGPIDQVRVAIRQPDGAVLHFRRPRVSWGLDLFP